MASSITSLAALLVLPAARSQTILQRVVVPDAVCLDGSPYSYYISVGGNASRFFFYHQGGSWCQHITECAARALTPLGSSVNWTDTVTVSDGMSRSPGDNPLMYSWSFVYMPYCDGGSFTGDASAPNPSGNGTLFFHGLKIRQATISSLSAQYGFGVSTTDIVVGGGSAGGLAAYVNVDWYAAQAPNAKARGMPDSGSFMDGNYTRDGKADYDADMQNLYDFMNASASLSPACTAAIGYKCLFAYLAMPFIKTPILALNSAYDATEGDGQCGASSGIIFDWNNASSVNACGDYQRGLYKKLWAPPSAAFVDSCHHHCGEWNMIHIDNLTSSTALYVWYTQGASTLPNGGYMDQNQMYPCATCCND